jgi:hypothetical protein
MAMRENGKKWTELCEQAADEQDPKKLAALILEINFMLEVKERRLLETVQPSTFGQDNRMLRSPSQSKSE